MTRKLILITLLVFGVFFIGCEKNNEENGDTPTEIPADPVNVTPPTPTKNNVQPTATFQQQGERIQINMQGLIDPSTQQPITFFYNSDNPAQSNLFIQQNGVTKGLLVTKVGTGNVLKADVVFTVDNSGSMGEEADAVANSIVEFANTLANSGLDVQFGCVGYDGWVNGAINLTSSANLSNYLNRTYYSGTSRTYGFSGSDSASLYSSASTFSQSVYGENGVVGCLFAYEYFNWRAGASKVFINFTDEPTQPDGSLNFNTAQLCNTIGGKATVHTVFSEDTTYYSGWWSETRERPWKMSECTGGTVKFIDPAAENFSLTDLPVVGALSNSYLVEYMKGSTTVQEWLVRIIVYTSTADGEISYNVTY